MNPLFDAAREVCVFMAERKWKFCIIGGLAVQQWGEPRTTLDADFTLLTGWGDEERYVREILNHFESRLSDEVSYFVARRIVLARASNGVEIDIALGALPFEESMMERAVNVEFSPDLSLPCCTAEDLIIMKAFAGRARDWMDVEMVVNRQSQLDVQYILDHIMEFNELSSEPDLIGRVRRLLGVRR